MYSYILENKLKSQRYVLILGGSNLKLSQIIGKNIIKKFKLHITHIITKSLPPHNGCPTKIKKRKKINAVTVDLKEFSNQLSVNFQHQKIIVRLVTFCWEVILEAI